jgi:ubiquinone/menaquinone biosynthesis C-methylase UbiE
MVTKSEKDFWGEVSYNDADMISHIMQKRAKDYSYALLGDIRNKKILEVGCGSGAQTAYFAKKGAVVTAIDVSEGSINETKKRCLEHGIKNATILKMGVEEMPFSKKFDYVYINNVLMHVEDKDKAIQNMLKALKESGRLVMKESLKHWIFSFPYRVVSTYRETKPQYMDYNLIKSLNFKHREFYLFSTFFLFLFYISKNKKAPHKIFNFLSKQDDTLMRYFPTLKFFSWVSVVFKDKY